MIRRTATLLVVLIWATACLGQEPKETPGRVELADGDTMVFLGDSITHQCLYTQYVEDYFYTRYPKRRIRFYNAGVSGDQADDALVRFDEDIAAARPKYVTVLIGMNDGQYTRFEHEIFETYERDMTHLLDRIESAGATAIVMSPTMYDLRPALVGDNWVKPDRAAAIHYNAVLAFFGAWGREQAAERGLGFVNMYEPLNRITREQRKEDPAFTLIEDAVHPGANGQLVMACALLQDIGAEQQVSSILIERKADRWAATAKGGQVSEVDGETIRFTFTADSLPWVVPEEAALGYRISRAGRQLSRETMRVVGLAPGNYRLSIDGTAVGTHGHVRWAAGVALQGNAKTPQYAQAMRVAMLGKEKNDQAVRPLRDQWSELKERREEEASDPEKFRDWRSEFAKKVAELQKKARRLEDKIYEINKPGPHTYELSAVR